MNEDEYRSTMTAIGGWPIECRSVGVDRGGGRRSCCEVVEMKIVQVGRLR